MGLVGYRTKSVSHAQLGGVRLSSCCVGHGPEEEEGENKTVAT